MLRQLVYSSSAALDGAALSGLLDQARAANGPAGLTGLLAAGDGLLFQVLEGPRDTVEAAFRRIMADTRHRHVRVIQDGEAASREFAGCPMGFRRLDGDALRLIAARARAGQVPVSEMVAVLGDPEAAARTQRLPLAA